MQKSPHIAEILTKVVGWLLFYVHPVLTMYIVYVILKRMN